MSRFAAHVVAPALVLGLLIGGALEVSAPAEAHAVTAALDAPLAPKPPDLSDEERRAVEDRKAGRPFDQRAYKRAEQKRKQTEKFEGERNRQKRGTQTKPGAPAPKPAPAPAPAPKPDAPAPPPAAPPKEPPPAPKPGPAPEPAPPKAKPGPPPS